MVYTLDNIYEISLKDNPVKTSRILRNKSKWKSYKLEAELTFLLSNGSKITIKKGFEWDKSSVPRIFWWLLPPDGDFIVGALIHDYLYQNNLFTRKFADKEMYKWSKATNGTKNVSLQRIDNNIRYYGVRLFGWFTWRK